MTLQRQRHRQGRRSALPPERLSHAEPATARTLECLPTRGKVARSSVAEMPFGDTRYGSPDDVFLGAIVGRSAVSDEDRPSDTPSHRGGQLKGSDLPCLT